ncbi:Chemotaxis protein methyltransferase CheR [Psychrobacter nivimaris]|uniref:Chemotaxis protein methyltransferase CheR n=1 Tax=Psychrobacter nivimaris TaxID=281738 RepID=A0A6N7BW41_9GAMM|nr:CheR family methyltransferase [Psychrobacter nivimaris]KAF0568568.1 Chemotaxis protein methyltransferase CheR [Psychrobacter nivimaris]
MKVDSLDVQRWQNYIEQETGFVLPDIQLQWLANAIDCTAMSNGLSVQQLWYQLSRNNELRQQLLDKVLIHESRFFRHRPSIDFVTEYALQHHKAGNIDSLFRIWSVGCASGQEAWSLAMSLAAQRCQDYVILGTDISEEAIKSARLGQYDNRQQTLIPQSCQSFVQPLPSKGRLNRLKPSTSEAANSMQENWQVAPVLQPHVSFSVHNIIEQKPPTTHLQNVIICQNMLLYFRKFDQRDILARLSDQCALEGYIVLAPGEALFWRPSNMRRIAHPQVNVWQKISA